MPPDSARIGVLEAGEAVAPQQGQRPRAGLGELHALDLHAEDDVVGEGAPRQQQVLLQHVADAPDGAGGVDPIDQDAALARLLQAGHDVEDGALAAARRPDQADEPALRNRQADVIERMKDARRRREFHADVIDQELGRGHRAPPVLRERRGCRRYPQEACQSGM